MQRDASLDVVCCWESSDFRDKLKSGVIHSSVLAQGYRLQIPPAQDSLQVRFRTSCSAQRVEVVGGVLELLKGRFGLFDLFLLLLCALSEKIAVVFYNSDITHERVCLPRIFKQFFHKLPPFMGNLSLNRRVEVGLSNFIEDIFYGSGFSHDFASRRRISVLTKK